MADGIYQSVMCFFMPYFMYRPANFETISGSNISDRARIGCVVAACAILSTNVYVIFSYAFFFFFFFFCCRCCCCCCCRRRSSFLPAPLHTQEGDTLSWNYTLFLGFRLGSLPRLGDPRQAGGWKGIPGAEHSSAQVAKGPRGDMPTSALLQTGGTGKGSRDQPLQPRFSYPYQQEAKGPGPGFSSPIFPNSQVAKGSREQHTYS